MKALFLALSFLILGCVQAPPKPVRSQLQIRELQTRSFQNRDAKATLRAVIQSLLDEGYLIRNADKDLGFINASKQVDVTDPNERMVNSIFMGERATWMSNATLECSVTVEQFGNDSRVRIVIQRIVQNNLGSPVSTETVEDPSFYQNLFSKIDKGLYLAQERL